MFGTKTLEELKAEFVGLDQPISHSDKIEWLIAELAVERKLLVELYTILLGKSTKATQKEFESKVLKIVDEYSTLLNDLDKKPALAPITKFHQAIDALQKQIYDRIRKDNILTQVELSELNDKEMEVNGKTLSLFDKEWHSNEVPTNYSKKWCCCFTGTPVAMDIEDSFIAEWANEFNGKLEDEQLFKKYEDFKDDMLNARLQSLKS